MANFKESNFGKKVKQMFSNKAAVATFATLIVVLGILVAVSISANRSRVDTPDAGTTAEATSPADILEGSETLPTYNGGTTNPDSSVIPEMKLPVASGTVAKDHDPTIQVYSQTMGDYRVHLGLDIATEEGADVSAVADGKVSKVWEDALMGTCVAITHNGDAVSIYKNLSKELASGIKENATVKCGQVIGQVGETAIVELADEPHLHFEVTVGGLAVDPMDYFSTKDAAVIMPESTDEGK